MSIQDWIRNTWAFYTAVFQVTVPRWSAWLLQVSRIYCCKIVWWFTMDKAYTELYYHLVWATWNRYPFITPEIQGHLYRYLLHQCQEYAYDACAINGMEDHLHVVVRLGPTLSISEVTKKLKGSSSRFCNEELKLETPFKWQRGYGALTFGKRDLSKIVSYVQNQKERHRNNQLNSALENASEWMEIEKLFG